MLNPSTLTTAEASISGEDACKSRKRSTMSWERDFVKAYHSFFRYGRKSNRKKKLINRLADRIEFRVPETIIVINVAYRQESVKQNT
jgi:hypothetical protein